MGTRRTFICREREESRSSGKSCVIFGCKYTYLSVQPGSREDGICGSKSSYPAFILHGVISYLHHIAFKIK